MPSKLTNMLASGRPVIATAAAGTALAELIQRHDVGEVVAPGDPIAVAEAVTALMTDDKRRRRQGANARAYSEAFLDRDRLLEEAMSRLRQRRRPN
jgi:colanic acid biosynthesis glycosyl transferase WcaI